MMDPKPTVGRIVHYVLPDGRSAGDVRPGIIVRVWGEDQARAGMLAESALGTVQLQVFTDGTNDGLTLDSGAHGMAWRTSVPYDPDGKPGSWHWPPRA